MRSLAGLVVILFLTGCSAWRAPGTDWGSLVTGAEGLNAEALVAERDRAVQAYSTAPTDETRLHLAYLLSRPGTAVQDLEASQELLNEIPPASPYAPVRDLLRREVGLVAQLEAARRVSRLQASRLDAVEADLADRDRLSADLERTREECRMLRAQLQEAHRQLGALKAIDSDLAEGDEEAQAEDSP